MRYRKLSAAILLVCTILLGTCAQQAQKTVDAASQKEHNDTMQTIAKETAIQLKEKELEVEESLLTPEEVARRSLPGIICWGDSLTYGWYGDGVSFPKVLEERLAREILDIPVINMGACGEDSITIAGRSGGIPYVVSEDMVIGENAEPVPIVFTSEDGRKVLPSFRTDVGINSCSIAGVEGTLTILEPLNPDSAYTFTRSTAGEAVSVSKGTKIITEASAEYQDYLSIVFVGTNGGYTDYDDLIAQQNAIIASRTANTDRFLIIGITNGKQEDMAEYDAAMQAAYGEKYFNLREYMSVYGLANAGLTPTAEDELAMAEGIVPSSLRVDPVHFTPKGYETIGNAVYEKLNTLGYFDEAREALANH